MPSGAGPLLSPRRRSPVSRRMAREARATCAGISARRVPWSSPRAACRGLCTCSGSPRGKRAGWSAAGRGARQPSCATRARANRGSLRGSRAASWAPIRPVPFTSADGREGADLFLAPEAFREAFAADVDQATADVMAAAQRPYAAAAFAGSPSGPPAWKTAAVLVPARHGGQGDPAGAPAVHGRARERDDRGGAGLARLVRVAARRRDPAHPSGRRRRPLPLRVALRSHTQLRRGLRSGRRATARTGSLDCSFEAQGAVLGCAVDPSNQPTAEARPASPTIWRKRQTVRLAGLDSLEHVLRAAGRDDDQPEHRVVAGVPGGVGHPPRDEYQRAGRDPDLAVAEQERGLTARDVEGLVGVRVDVEGRRRLARRNRPGEDPDAPSVSVAPKLAGSGASDGGIKVHPLIVCMTADPRRGVRRSSPATQERHCCIAV